MVITREKGREGINWEFGMNNTIYSTKQSIRSNMYQDRSN